MQRSALSSASPGGALTTAAHELDDIVAHAQRLADETAWECDAARAYRARLDDWVQSVRALHALVQWLEHDTRATWRRLALGAS